LDATAGICCRPIAAYANVVKCFAISEVAADWHEAIIIAQLTVARARGAARRHTTVQISISLHP